MTKDSLVVEKLGKAFKTYASEWHRFLSWFGVPVSVAKEVWALKDISFRVKYGEALGIVGQNGAGKSTLLKLITGTLQSSCGQINVNGRVAAILELGMGFNLEFTGRQNVIYSGGLMGFSNKQLRKVMPEIQLFAEIGEYFDYPMRMYSSGMKMRVAFAIATAFRPDVLIIDEALSVGDAYFQFKSFERIKTFQDKGTTLLIVSHDKATIQGCCTKTILLNNGHLIKEGLPDAVMDYYNALIAEKHIETIQTIQHISGKTQTISGTGEVQIENITLFNSSDCEIDTVNVGESVKVQAIVKANMSVDQLVFGFLIRDHFGQSVYGTNTYHTGQVVKKVVKGTKYRYTIYLDLKLGEGIYSLTTSLSDGRTHLGSNYEWKDFSMVFTVVNLNKTKFVGNVWLQPEIEIQTFV